MLRKIARHWLTYYLLSWMIALGGAAWALYCAWHSMDNNQCGLKRGDGNYGHTTIDFGGQWLMGRMLITGHGRQLYNRVVQRDVLLPAYPDEDQEPDQKKNAILYPNPKKSDGAGPGDDKERDQKTSAVQKPTPKKSDVENLMEWMMGNDDSRAPAAAGSFLLPLGETNPLPAAVAFQVLHGEGAEERWQKASAKQIGGPLYPPVNAVIYAPLGLLDPHRAYRLQQILNLVLAFLAGFGLVYLSQGRLWLPVAALAVMVFPGFGGSINLGQNATLTLTILVWGWALAVRGRPGWGGVVWGLLAFKPVWALTFLLVPLLTRRWRLGLAMVGTGLVWGLITLPFVGVQSWFDWLEVGRLAAQIYKTDQNWIFLSRDLLGIPRRWLFTFNDNEHRDGNWLLPAWIGWGLILLVLEGTVRLVFLRRQQARSPDGPPAAFLFLGAWMCCYHFMYYDVLLGFLPLGLLFTDPRRYLKPLLLAVVPLRRSLADPGLIAYYQPALPRGAIRPSPWLRPANGQIWVLNRMAPTLFLLLVAVQHLFPLFNWGCHYGQPWDTFCLMWLWLWCSWQWLRRGEKVATSWDEG